MKFLRGVFGFGRKEYAVPQIAPVPSGQGSDQNGTYINEEARQIVVKIFDGGQPHDLAAALGTLEIAKDVIKNVMSVWHQKEARRKSMTEGIIKPSGNGHG